MDSNLIQAINEIYPQVRFAHDDSDHVIAVVPEQYKLESIERFQQSPYRLKQQAVLQSLESFLKYTEAHKEESSVIFFDEKELIARLIVDYHERNDLPSWCDHKAIYAAELDERWVEWRRKSNERMNQIELAQFIERHVKDFKDPTGAEMLTMATNFQVNRKVTYGNAVNLSTGEVQFEYSNASGGKGTMTVPDTFKLAIPVFKNGDHYEVEAKLRYRLHDENLVLMYELINDDDIMRDAVSGEEGMIVKLEASGLPVYLGKL
ncbi:MAG: YfdQ family protein [Saccharospirillum sp.]|nr:YfdQ family protein [Saccharospirillum sp.]